MNQSMLERMKAAVSTPEMVEATVGYLTEQMGSFLRPGDKLLICFPDDGPGSVGSLFAAAARRLRVTSVFLGDDKRWKNILQLSFRTKATAIAAPPLVVLGLTKLSKSTKTPLYFRNVITAGYSCYRWMVDGIKRGLDCEVWGCFDPCHGSVIAGFTCKVCAGIHIRQDAFSFELHDENEKGGYIVISPKSDPSVRLNTLERASFSPTRCECGQDVPLLVDFEPGEDVDELLLEMGSQFHTWTSILDVKLHRGDYGLELELITFPGEKLPKLPSVAKLNVRAWDPERDVPNWFHSGWRKSMESR